jgi:hypothetical protein
MFFVPHVDVDVKNQKTKTQLGTGLDWTGLDWTGLDWTGLEFCNTGLFS